MKKDLKLIERGYMLEALSPRGYADLLYIARKKEKGEYISDYAIDDVLCCFPLPWTRVRKKSALFNKLAEAASAKEAFERRIEKIRRDAFDARV